MKHETEDKKQRHWLCDYDKKKIAKYFVNELSATVFGVRENEVFYLHSDMEKVPEWMVDEQKGSGLVNYFVGPVQFVCSSFHAVFDHMKRYKYVNLYLWMLETNEREKKSRKNRKNEEDFLFWKLWMKMFWTVRSGFFVYELFALVCFI